MKTGGQTTAEPATRNKESRQENQNLKVKNPVEAIAAKVHVDR
jgi:hypothetical protein